ncbi:MAG TPA: tetratricopeptide repeat protein [Nevskia sp.]|nr:tetratricopeptide repeat protein [Nevskia sp.]
MGHFISELRRRNVLRVAAFYAAAGWLLVQVATQVFPFFDIPNEVVRWVVIVIALGFPLALVLSWVYELTPQGLKLESEIAAGDPVHREGARRLDRWIIVALTLAVVALLVGLLWRRPPVSAPAAAPDKSIAVLPFENLSDDKSNAWFAQGMQDEILTRLAKIGQLKVISRSSTQHYGSSPDNLSEVARQLGVANILEGSVQKAGDKVHVNVQLIEAATGQHLWADIYDRKLDDVFGVEGEVAQAIASALQAKLNGGEQQALVQRPTNNTAAYQAYLRGLGDEMRAFNAFTEEDLLRTEADYAEAVRLDPDFAQAWAKLSIVRSYMHAEIEHGSPEVLTQAKEAADTALRLRPDLGEPYLAQGYYHYRGLSDYEGGLDWFNQALQRLPNNAEVLAAIAYIERRQNKWAESTAHLEQATMLDPRNTSMLSGLALNYQALRQYRKALDTAERALAVLPGDRDLLIGKAGVYQAMGDFAAAEQLLAPLPFEHADRGLFFLKVRLLLDQRRIDDAAARLEAALRDPGPGLEEHRQELNLFLGVANLLKGRREAAQAACRLAQQQLEALPAVAASSDGAAEAGSIQACLGNRAEALRLEQRSREMDAKDALIRPKSELVTAQVHEILGEHEEALAGLQRLLPQPNGLSPGELQTPWWDGVRQDPRFQQLVAAAQNPVL